MPAKVIRVLSSPIVRLVPKSDILTESLSHIRILYTCVCGGGGKGGEWEEGRGREGGWGVREEGDT